MHPMITRLSMVVAAAVLAACATPIPHPDGPPGNYLVYRDSSGAVLRQFEYPDDTFCRKVEAVAGNAARCQAQPAAGLQAHATLRYNPPGVLVQGLYADMARCRTDTATMAPGVQLINACAPR